MSTNIHTNQSWGRFHFFGGADLRFWGFGIEGSVTRWYIALRVALFCFVVEFSFDRQLA